MKTTTKLFTIVALLATVLFSACKEEETPTPVNTGKSPVETFANDSLRYEGSYEARKSYSFIFEFKPTKNGKITALGARCTPGKYAIGLFKVHSASASVMVADSIVVSDSTGFTYKSISEISVTKDSIYVVAINNINGVDGLRSREFVYDSADPTRLIDFRIGTYDDVQFLGNTTILSTVLSDDVLSLYSTGSRSYDYNTFNGVPAFKFIAD